jgi:integrase
MKRGDGRVFQRDGSPYWWCAYYDAQGKEQREVCKHRKSDEKLDASEANRAEAEHYLAKQVDAVKAEKLGAPAFIGPQQRRIRVNQILDDLIAEYELGGKLGIPRKASPQMNSHLKRVRDYFGHRRAVSITKQNVNAFVSLLQSQGKKNATINRSLQLLGQAYKASKIPLGFDIPQLDESGNVRKGKFTPAEAEMLAASLPSYMADVARFAYVTGARAGEILKLRWNYLDGDAISVPGTDTKNREGRDIVFTPELEEIIARCKKARSQDCDLIFHHDGKPIADYRKCWYSACVINGLGRFYCRTWRNEQGQLDSVLDAERKCGRCGQKWEVPSTLGESSMTSEGQPLTRCGRRAAQWMTARKSPATRLTPCLSAMPTCSRKMRSGHGSGPSSRSARSGRKPSLTIWWSCGRLAVASKRTKHGQNKRAAHLGGPKFMIPWLRGVDLNHRPLGYEPNELPDCSTPRSNHSNRLRRRSNRYGLSLSSPPLRDCLNIYPITGVKIPVCARL